MSFYGAQFGDGHVSFYETQFGDGNVSFRGAKFGNGNMSFRGAKFGNGTLSFDDTSWDRALEVRASGVSMQRCILNKGALIVANGPVNLTEARIEHPTTIRTEASCCVASLDQTRLTAELILEPGVDMSRCTFTQTVGADLIRPAGRAFGRGRFGRQRLAQDEWRWSWDRSARPMSDAGLSARYRQIRTGLEKAGNIPGAHDFYYGEMECRRRDAWGKRYKEWLVLSVYNLVSGYGLRAWRAFAAYAATIAASVYLLDRNGFQPQGEPQRLSVARTIEYSLRASTSFLRPLTVEGLSTFERYTQLGLKTIGPILLGLAFLAVRNGVKR